MSNFAETTHFGIADESVYARIINEVPGSEEIAHAHVATLATVSSGELANLLPGHGIVPNDEYDERIYDKAVSDKTKELAAKNLDIEALDGDALREVLDDLESVETITNGHDIATTYWRLGEAADFVMRHATEPADRTGAAVVAVELHNTAKLSGRYAMEGLDAALGTSSVAQGPVAEEIVDRYGLSQNDDTATMAAHITSLARSWESPQAAS